MTLKLTVLSTTALTMIATIALAADNNSAYLLQTGNSNQSTIIQSGSGNQAGSQARSIKQDRYVNPERPATGQYNVLSIKQSGSNNQIGLEANIGPAGVIAGHGISQDIGYAFGGNRSGNNLITIEQLSDSNVVGAISQKSRTHEGGNTLVITQGSGTSADSNNNRIGSVTQYRTQTTMNKATLTQSGASNVITEVFQQSVEHTASATAVPSPTNDINVNIAGDNNGGGSFSQGRGAAAVGIAASTIKQNNRNSGYGQGNKATLTITSTGNANQFAIEQNGNQNTTGQLLISGSGNEIAIQQINEPYAASDRARRLYDGNEASIGAIAGDRNIIGLSQNGKGNHASLTIVGDENLGYHGLTNTIFASSGLVAGLLTQRGEDNDLRVSVTGSQNVLATVQGKSPQSSSNLILATITGDSNQVGIIQNGSANTASLVQSGNSNVSYISQ